MEPMDVKGVGRMAVIQDPQGAALSVIAYSM
jgi:predicted enzyme related to lactoylglutathione lyase